MSEEAQKPNFESIKQISPYGDEYWSARDLAPLLGYSNWQNFELAINKAKLAAQQVGSSVQNDFTDANKIVSLGARATRKVKDYSLSRFACYLIAQNGDPRKPEIAAAQVYFAIATRENELQQLREDQAKRLELRERISENNKDLNAAAFEAGVTHRGIGPFHNAGYQGLYNGLGVEGIKARKGINDKEDILDRMGSSELAANDFRVTQARDKLRREAIKGQEQAIQAHREVGKTVRKAIAEIGGTMPEELSAEPSIKPLLDEKKRRHRKALPSSSTANNDGSHEGTSNAPVQDKLFDL